jgi:hypothetical protein
VDHFVDIRVVELDEEPGARGDGRDDRTRRRSGDGNPGSGFGADVGAGVGGGAAVTGGEGGCGTTVSTLSYVGAPEEGGAIVSTGATGEDPSSAATTFAANSAATQSNQPIRFIRLLPAPS